MTPQRFTRLCAIPLFLLIGTQFASANLITNPGFETGNFSGWTPTPAGSGSFFGVTDVTGSTGGSGNFIALFGATGSQSDAISQSFATVPGGTYTLSFFLRIGTTAEVANNDFRVFFDGVQVFSLTDSNPGFSVFSIANLLTNSALTTLRFEGRNSNRPGLTFLDNISVEGVSSVPETGGNALLLGMGLAGLISLQRGRRLV
jgi:hypothetical protein